jgi:hypothetical protein
MFGLQVGSPGDRVLEFCVVFLQDFHRFPIGNAHKIGTRHMVQPLQQTLVHKPVEKVKVVRAALHYRADNIFHHVLREGHVVVQVRKRDLRFNHPELRGMALRIGFFRAERRAESIYFPESHCHAFRLELPGNGERSVSAEKVLRIVGPAVLCFRDAVEVERSHGEHFAGALAVAAGNQRGIHIDKAAFLKKAVDRIRCGGTDAECGAKQIGARAQMRHGAQIFRRMALFLQRIIRRGRTLFPDGRSVYLERLLRLRCGQNAAL